jgi:hypothetical protein
MEQAMNIMIPSLSATATKSEESANKKKKTVNKKKKTVGRAAKLKSSNWYQGAAQSIRINKRKSLEKSR